LQSKMPGPTLDLAIKSAVLHESLEEELGVGLEYRKSGGMIIIETMEEKKAMISMVERQQKAGVDVKLISGEEAREHQPGLSSDLIGSTWWEGDAEVNPLKVSYAFANAARRLGAEIRLGSPVTGLITEGEKVKGVEVSDEKIY